MHDKKSKVIWKHELEKTDRQTIRIPRGAKLLSAREQNGDAVCVWFECDPNVEVEGRDILIFGTGNPIPKFQMCPDPRYLGTAVLMGGRLVLHVYEFLDDTEE